MRRKDGQLQSHSAVPALIDRIVPRPRDKHHEARRHATAYKVLSVCAIVALILQTSMLFISLFGDPLPYNIANPGAEPIDSPEFGRILGQLTGGGWSQTNKVDVETNGGAFYEAELAAIAQAKRFVHIECYIFQKGRVADRFLNALEERAASGVEVRMVIDSVGSTGFPKQRFEKLQSLGGRVAWYHPIRWYNWTRMNNRTHREMVVVDGAVAFAGGAGFADQWLLNQKQDPQWRDTMLRFQGPAAADLNATFAENWLEASGDVIVAPEYFPDHPGQGGTRTLVVTSSPMAGRSTEARVLFQALVAKAARTIHITNPYFLPDKSLRQELVKAVQRGAEVTIVVPGAKNDHLLTRRSSRALYGDLLKAGARIFEYGPSMIHAKIALFDGKWAVAGSTNLDSRSFGLNDEVNVAMPDPAVVARLEEDFQRDLSRSREMTYEQWSRRPIWEKMEEWCGWIIQKQE
jgi:cardiolipin synthase